MHGLWLLPQSGPRSDSPGFGSVLVHRADMLDMVTNQPEEQRFLLLRDLDLGQRLPDTHRLARGILIAANLSECGCLEPLRCLR